MKPVNFDSFTKDYNQLLLEQTQFFTADEAYFAAYKVQIVKRLIKTTPVRILEYGCGIGRNIKFLKTAFTTSEIFGSDISEKSIEIAKKENPNVLFWVEGEQKLEEAGFDLIFVAGVFHHIPPPERFDVMKKLLNILNPGGNIFIFEHNPYNPITRKIVNSCPYDEGVILLPPRELKSYLQKAGFKNYQQGYTLFFPPAFKVLTCFESYLKWLPLGGQYWIRALHS
ncbi:MAG: class I SAM-dependent methyltransferase [Alphaproteobacteria bacterium]|nr:class I SAM-dependent methyltransferase [Alphaproteobacteria bacterium]